MKTKLSILALLLCLGAALTLVLAACSTSSAGNGEGDSSSSTGNVNLSSPVETSELLFTVGDEDTYVNLNSDKIELLGIYNAAPADPILKLEFSPTGWVKYDGNVVNSAITGQPDLGTYINLGNKDAYVDLTNNSIGCGDQTVGVQACLKKGEDGKDRCTSHLYKFNKPNSYCATSSSGGSGTRSSSSEATWRFGSKEGPISAGKNSEKEIPGFSARFTLSEKTVDGIDLTAISISGGNIRYTDVNYTDGDVGFDGYPVSNKDYPSKIFRLTQPVQSMDMENLNEYYIITASSGSDRYLIRVEPKDGPAGSPGDWDKKVYYWKVLEGPNL